MKRSRLRQLALCSLVLMLFGESRAAPPFKEYTFGFAGTVPVAADYDGDGVDDLAVYHASSGNWYIFRSSLGFIQEQFGFSGTIPVVGDYDGDGKDDKALFDPATANWYVFRSTLGYLLTQFGFPGVKPAPGDYDGDGKSDLAVYDAPNGQWYIFRSQLGQWNPQFGFAGTVPVAADYDGDGKTDIAVYNPPSGMWYLSRSSLGFLQQQFGFAGPLTAPADFDGDGRADYGLFNTNNHSRIFHTWQSTRGYYTITFPATGLPHPADFEGDGQKKLVVYNPVQGKWFADLTFIDWDLDGLPKSWEVAHGLNDQDNGSQNPAHGPGGDPDGDGYQNIYEYLGGSNPNNPGSTPPPTLTIAPGGMTIQQAIDSVNQPYAVIRLGPGTYSGPGNRDITLRGKKLMLVSQAGPDTTVLDAGLAGRGFGFIHGESRQSVVSGLTIIHGYAADGGGIQCITSSPTIFNCVIKRCEATAFGGGIALFGSSPRVVGCDFIENRAGAGGGAAYFSIHATTSFVLYGSSPVIERCLIEGNRATNGPGIFSADLPATHPYTGSNCATVTLLRCRIAGNVGGTGSGAVQLHDGKAILDTCIIIGNRASGMVRSSVNSGSGVTMKHCTIMNNLASSSPVGSGIFCSTMGGDAIALKNSIVWGNHPATAQVFAEKVGGLVADSCNVDQTPFPYLTNHAVFNNTLQVAPQLGSSGRVKAGSPMRNAGSPAFSVSPDIDGEPRDAQPDLGCDEFVDADGDTLPDYWETLYGLSPSVYHDPSGDSDGDGLTNAQEADQETDPLAPDTDGDGLNDAEELLLGTKPLSPDTDDDGLSDGDEVDQGTNPNSADTDGDGIPDPDDPAPNENGLADDVVLYVDSDGGAPQQVVSRNRVVLVPQGTKALYYRVTVFSREYPQFTSTQSQFDDVVTWSMDAPSPLQDQPLTSYHVNALHSQFGPGDFPGGNVVVKEGILNYSALTQHGPSSLNLEATAMNVSDSALGSGVGIQVSVLKVKLDNDGANTKFGFDDKTTPSKPWVCVEKFESTKIKATVDPASVVDQIYFDQGDFDGEKFSFSPAQPTASPQSVTIAGPGSEHIGWPWAEGTFYARAGCAVSSCPLCDEMGVFVGEDARPPTRYFVVSDPTYSATIPSPVPSDPNSEISSRWLQAAITPNALASVHTLQITYDTDGDGKLDNTGIELTVLVEEAAHAIGLANRSAEPNAIWVFFVEDIHFVQSDQDQAVGGFFRPSFNSCFIASESRSVQIVSQITAHEWGHAVGCNHVNNPFTGDNLMYPDTSGIADFISLWSWQEVER